jgi:hypothetical protein
MKDEIEVNQVTQPCTICGEYNYTETLMHDGTQVHADIILRLNLNAMTLARYCSNGKAGKESPR